MIVYAVEKLSDCWHEMIGIAAQHWQETMSWQHGKQAFNPSFDRYNQYDQAGWFVMFTARDEGVMVGYGMMYLTPSMHTQRFIATEDTIFLLPPYRKGRNGLRFYEFVEREMTRRGAVEIMVTAKPNTPASRLLEHLGCTLVNYQYCKHIGADSTQSESRELSSVFTESTAST